ncbi:MAG: hypothetical protein J6B87_05415 [Clostridia bacterium]|nr:hypothetical protein [Clostridia bacterium]
MSLKASPKMRRIRKDRMDRAMAGESEQKRREDKKRRLERDYLEMRKVVDFFYVNCPFELPNDEKETIERQLFNGKSTRNKLGVINFLNNIVGYRWPEWVAVAKNEFGIDY